jgi:hypothetical protein
MEDPGPSSAAAPEAPPPPPEEGDGWVLLPPSEVEGVDDPKVVHWEDLQQELARLWSLSAALQAARDRKAHLAARLESALEVIAKFGSQLGVSLLGDLGAWNVERRPTQFPVLNDACHE